VPTPTPPPADHAARCRELARLHGFVVYDRPDGRGRLAFHPSTCALPLRFFEAAGEDWHGLPLLSRFFAPDLPIAAVLACAEFKHVTLLLEVPAPAASGPEQAAAA
jgi:hypothetical protein